MTRAVRHATALCLGLALGVCLVLWSLPARAHASLVDSEPVGGAMLAAMPARVALTFTVRLDRVTVRDRSVTVTIPPSPQRGTYVLSWRVVSLDGHPVGGAFLFSVGEEGGRTTSQAAPSHRGFAAAFVLFKAVLYLSLMIGAGGAFARAWLNDDWPRRDVEPAIMTAILPGFPAVIALVGMQGLDALDAPAGALAEPLVWEAGLDTSFGITAIVAAFALFAGLFAALASTRRQARLWSLGALVGIGLSLAASGHASAASPQALMRPSVFLHGIAVALWIGSLLPLRRALHANGEATPMLGRFSRVIPCVLFVLLISGVTLAVVQIVRIDALWTTDYGAVLLGKLALVAVLLGLAAYNRFVLTAGASRGDAGATIRLRRSIAAEILVAVAIFGMVGVWRFTPPPRAILAAQQTPEFVHIHGAKAMADVTFAPPASGRRNIAIYLQTPDFRPLESKDVTLVIANPAAGIEPLSFPAQKTGEGFWTAPDVQIAVAGIWTVRVEILIDDFERAVLEDAVALRR
jgi:copper transport protein